MEAKRQPDGSDVTATQKLRSQTETVREDLRELGRITKDVAQEKLGVTRYVREKPVKSILIAGGVGLLVGALARIKSYLDYGMFTPVQVAGIAALEGDQSCVTEICERYRKRRDVMCEGLEAAGWQVEKPKATMFVWAKIPPQFQNMGSLEFSKHLLKEAKVAVSPGIGFGQYGDDHVRFALIENEHRTRQAIRGIKQMFKNR